MSLRKTLRAYYHRHIVDIQRTGITGSSQL